MSVSAFYIIEFLAISHAYCLGGIELIRAGTSMGSLGHITPMGGSALDKTFTTRRVWGVGNVMSVLVREMGAILN